MSDNVSRKFIDLIFQATAKWANWNPPSNIKVGDYGKLEMTGEFYREGNIYKDLHIYEDQHVIKLVQDNPPIQAAREDVFIAASRKVKRSDLKLGAELTAIPGLADASIKGQWSFGSKRGALLVMANPLCSYIPPATILKYLAEVEALKDMFLVTEVFSCPAYSLYLSNGSNEVVDLALVGTFPIPHSPGATAGVNAEGKWWTQNANGLFRSAREPLGNDHYTPLYMLRGIRKRKSFFSRRGELGPKPEGDDIWGEVHVPWNPLDEDGNEEEVEDTVFD